MGWFSSDEIMTNSAAQVNQTSGVEQILIAISVIIIAVIVVAYIIAKTCNKILSSHVSTAARREVELNRLNNGTVRV